MVQIMCPMLALKAPMHCLVSGASGMEPPANPVMEFPAMQSLEGMAAALKSAVTPTMFIKNSIIELDLESKLREAPCPCAHPGICNASAAMRIARGMWLRQLTILSGWQTLHAV